MKLFNKNPQPTPAVSVPEMSQLMTAISESLGSVAQNYSFAHFNTQIHYYTFTLG